MVTTQSAHATATNRAMSIPQTRDAKVRERLSTFARTNQGLPGIEYQYKLSKILATVELTDAGNSLRFLARYGHQFHFVPESGKWFQWNGRIWKTDGTFSIMNYALQVSAYIDTEADTIPLPQDKEGKLLIYPSISPLDKITPEQKAIIDQFVEHDKHVETLRKWARSSRSRRSLEAMVELLKAETGVTLLKAEFDTDDMLINCLNGILDLRTMEVRSHDKNALMTRITNVNAVPGATCPTWESFTLKVMKSRPALVKFLQQIAGMGLTGERYEDVFPVFYGAGENGKTVFQEVLREVYGMYADVATAGMFLERKNENDRFEVAGLDGIRFLFKDETKQGGILDEGTVKAMTGGGALKGEVKYGAHFTFTPKFTSILSTNHKPRITGNDNGIWRRVKLVPWEYSFNGDPEKKSKPEVFTEMRKEHEGIFIWAVAGLQALLTDGYVEPEEVKLATSEYRNTSDIVGAFIGEKCITGNEKECWVKLQDLYNVYRKYMEEESGNKPFSKPNFGELMSERGFEKGHQGNKGGWFWQGIRLRKEDEEQQVPGDLPTTQPTSTHEQEGPKIDTLPIRPCLMCDTTNWTHNDLGKPVCATCNLLPGDHQHTTTHEQEVPTPHKASDQVKAVPTFGVLYPSRTKCHECGKDPTEWVPATDKSKHFPWDCKHCLELEEVAV